MRTLLARLLEASQWGASLVIVAGCGADTSGSSRHGGLDGSPIISNLTAPPASICVGPIYDSGFGFHGQCCEKLICEAPTNGQCTVASQAHPPGYPPGSGSCTCGDLAIHGPYANPDANAVEKCCYLIGSIGCDGRPLIVDGSLRLAPVIDGVAWSAVAGQRVLRDIADLDVGLLSPAERAALAERWAERARVEHASVASFSRFSLSLLAIAAPPELVSAAHRAAGDEVRHARLALSLASRYAGAPMSFGALSLDGVFDEVESLEAIVAAAVHEGCVGETMSAIEADLCKSRARDTAVRSVLATIASDEARHAELAWAFVRWALGVHGVRIRPIVASAFSSALQALLETEDTEATPRGPGHGFLSRTERRTAREYAIDAVLVPAVAALLGSARSVQRVDVHAPAVA